MQTRSLKYRVLLFAVSLLVLLTVGLSYVYRVRRQASSRGTFENITTPRDVTLGDFTLTSLPDWHEGVFRKDSWSYVRYTNNEGLRGTEGLDIQLTWRDDKTKNIPQTAQDLQSAAKGLIKTRSSLDKLVGTTTKTISIRPTSLNGMTAIKIDYESRSSIMNSYGTQIAFINKNRYYILSSETSLYNNHLNVLPQQQTKLAQALATVSKQLIPSPSQ